MFIKSFILYFFLTVVAFSSIAQQASHVGFEIKAFSLNEDKSTFTGSGTALAIRVASDAGDFIRVKLNDSLVDIPFDSDAPHFTYFLSVSFEIKKVELVDELEADVFLIHSGETPTISNGLPHSQRQDCSFEFNAIDQDSWRAGLGDPNYSRSFTNVEHLIVHHSAGSNSNTNYTQVVRDIYVYHTQVNGWSDIGYNYLVAQDGAIYKGRDPENGAQDDVLGAHFCGKNSGTMGVCVLGNYETTEPLEVALASLRQILAFKTSKESLSPTGNSQHDTGLLANIAGHRDGCSTACPGSNLYAQLDDLRLSISTLLDDCESEEEPVLAFVADKLTPLVGETVEFSNLSAGYDEFIWSFEDGIPSSATWSSMGFNQFTTGGPKDVMLVGIAEDRRDTLLKEDYIYVYQNEVYPTLITSVEDVIIFPAESDVSNVHLINMNGQVISFFPPLANQINLPASVPNGMYTLQASIDGRLFVYRILVRK